MIQNLHKSRLHKIRSDYGLTDYYKKYKKIHKRSVDYSIYRDILRECNDTIRNLIANEAYDFKMPQRMGIVKVRKFIKAVKIDKNGKLKHSLAPNWKATLDLWRSDNEAREAKTVIFHDNDHSGGYTFKIVYSKKTANFRNKSAYRFHPNRQMSRALARSIKENNLDTFLINS